MKYEIRKKIFSLLEKRNRKEKKKTNVESQILQRVWSIWKLKLKRTRVTATIYRLVIETERK